MNVAPDENTNVGSGKYRAFISYSQAADGRLAPAVQAGLQRFSKPWYRLRALRVFRDQTGLAVTPELWGAIERALKDSNYFILLASPPAAQSQWVAQEVDWWLRNRSVNHLLVVLTDGDLVWDRVTADFDWTRTDAWPRRLEKAFPQEPLFLDLRWARRDTDLSLRRPRFADAIANLSATLRGQSLDELVGEDVRQHERTLTLLRSAVAVLLVLTVCAGFAAVIALQARKSAAQVAQEQATNTMARESEARSRRLTSVSLNEATDPELKILLAAEAVRSDPTAEATSALRQSLFTLLKPVLTLPRNDGPVNYAIFSPDGTKALAFGDAAPRLVDAATGAVLRELRQGSNPVYHASFSPTGRRICATSGDGMARLWDVETGKVVIEFPHEHVLGAFLSSDESRVLTLGEGDAILWNAATGEKIFESLTYALERLHPHYPEAAFHPDGSRVALCGRVDPEVIETKSGKAVMALKGHLITPQSVDYSPDGQWLVTTGKDGTIRRWRAATGQGVSTWKHDAPLIEARFSPDGKWVVAVDENRVTLVWEVAAGRKLVIQPPTDGPVIFEFSPIGTCLATGSLDSGTAEIWDIATATKLAELTSEEGTLQTLRFSPDSKRLIVGGYGMPVQIFACEVCGSTGDLLKYAQTRVSRALTPEERAKY